MATPPRYFQKGSFYHVFNRGNRKENIFLQYWDYVRFLEKTKEYKDRFGVSVLVYCLMPNHFHFLLKQETELPITFFMLRLSTAYAKYFNIKYQQVGSLFQGRFKAKLIETDDYLLQVSRYIHRNPRSTPGVELREYPWSSYDTYLGSKKENLADPTYILSYFKAENQSEDYKEFTEHDFTEEVWNQIKDIVLDDDVSTPGVGA